MRLRKLNKITNILNLYEFFFFSSYSNLERILFTNIHPTPVPPQSLNHHQEISHSPVTRNPDMHTLNLRYRSLACIYYFIKCAGPYIIITHTHLHAYIYICAGPYIQISDGHYACLVEGRYFSYSSIFTMYIQGSL